MPAHRFWMKSGASGRAIYLDHTAIHNDKDHDGQHPHAQVDNVGLQPQADQLPHPHCFKLRFQVGQRSGDVHVPVYHAGALAHHILGDVKHRHDDSKAVGEQVCGNKGFENPLEDVERIKIVHVVLFQDHLDQLIDKDKSQDNSRNGNDDGFRKILDHAEHAAIPALRCLSYL